MTQCEQCHKETDKQPEHRTGMDYNPTTGKETPVPYTMPVYCDDCLKDLEATQDDEKDMQKIRQEWQAYRNDGL